MAAAGVVSSAALASSWAPPGVVSWAAPGVVSSAAHACGTECSPVQQASPGEQDLLRLTRCSQRDVLGCAAPRSSRSYSPHGLAAWLDFRPVAPRSDRLTLGATIEPQQGYPWRLRIETTFEVRSNGVEMTWDDSCPWVQIHTCDLPGGPGQSGHRVGLAVEPRTCGPDAFNAGRYDCDPGLLRVGAGRTVTASWRIAALTSI